MAADPAYSDLELSAIQEVANIGTGNAATALAQLVNRSVDIGVPQAELVPLAEAAERIGPLESMVFAVLTPVKGVMAASMLLAFPDESAEALCGMLGCSAETEIGHSCLQEIGNILTGSYTTAIAGMTGIDIEPEPPMLAYDMLGSVIDGVLALSVESNDTVLFLQTAITVEGEPCNFGFLFIPREGAVNQLLIALGLG
jgi:chemotaxis protein CheC